MDLVLAIHHLKSKLTTTIDCRNVYGHQDRGQKKTDVKEQECPSPDETEPHATTGRSAAPPPNHGGRPQQQMEPHIIQVDEICTDGEYNDITESLQQGPIA